MQQSVAQLPAQNRLPRRCLAATTVVAVAVALTGASDRKGKAGFTGITGITVERINMANADGSRTLVPANGECLPAPVATGGSLQQAATRAGARRAGCKVAPGRRPPEPTAVRRPHSG